MLPIPQTLHRRIPTNQVRSVDFLKRASVDILAATSSREAHAKQKAEKQERKASKPNADSIARSKKLWERLRRKSHVPKDERKNLVAELFDIITGRVKDFVFKHDSVRVIQTALKYANIDQRKMIAKELQGDYKALAESKYAKFLIGKILVHGDEETRDMVIPEFNRNVRRLIRHPEAAWILDDIYRGIATPSQKALLLREWYGADFAIFGAEKVEGTSISADLKEILSEHPEKRKPVMRSLLELINILVQKKTTGFTMLHDAMLQYFLNVQVTSEEANEFIELLKGDEEGDLLKNLAFTKSGARLVCLALARGSAKDRKLILRVYKGNIQTMAYDMNAHQVLLTAYDVIDDTVLVSKSVFPELLCKEGSETYQQDLMAAITNLNARVPLLYPFCGKSKVILPTEVRDILTEIDEIRETTSKKDPKMRRKELLAGLSTPLLDLIAQQAGTLIETSFGCEAIVTVLLDATGDREAAMHAVANLASGGTEIQNLLAQAAPGRMLKTLVVGGRYDPEKRAVEPADPPLGFHNILYAKIKDDLVSWATGPNSFVVVGLLEAQGFGHADELKAILKKNEDKLRSVTQHISQESDKKQYKKTKGKQESDHGIMKPRNNAGSAILLKKLKE